MDSFKILVADGSATYRKMFTKAAAELDKNAVISSASNGSEAKAMIKLIDFQLIVIDAEIAGLDALLEEIKSAHPKTYVLLATRPSKMSNEICTKSLAAGAADCMIKPIQRSYSENFDVIKDKMDGIFKALSENSAGKPPSPIEHETTRHNAGLISFRPGIVLIAASTGGPSALENVLSKIEEGFPAPILIVQHMLPHFTETLAQNLNQKSKLRVKVADEGESVVGGTVYIAPGGVHMVLASGNTVGTDDSPPKNGVKPSADVLFESVAEHYSGHGVLAVILTGMGRDGTDGLARLKDKIDCFCIAQSEETCVVYGMPRVAVESGLVDKVLDLGEIADEITRSAPANAE